MAQNGLQKRENPCAAMVLGCAIFCDTCFFCAIFLAQNAVFAILNAKIVLSFKIVTPSKKISFSTFLAQTPSAHSILRHPFQPFSPLFHGPFGVPERPVIHVMNDLKTASVHLSLDLQIPSRILLRRHPNYLRKEDHTGLSDGHKPLLNPHSNCLSFLQILLHLEPNLHFSLVSVGPLKRK